MSPEMPEMAKRGPEKKEKVDPEKALQDVIYFAKRIIENAEDVKTMLKIAKEKGIQIDINNQIKQFVYPSEKESYFIQINGALNNLKAEIAKQGLKITYEELRQYKEKGK
jgi:hypothetical protein